MKTTRLPAIGLLSLLCMGCAASPTLVWDLREAHSVGGHAVQVLGAPRPLADARHPSLCFDGQSDGLIIPVNPIEGWGAFTIEVLLRPEGDGPEEQRFLHIQDDLERRVLLETRVNGDGSWSLDTFLRADDAHKLTLLDRAITSPTGRWHWAALVYDGRTQSHYVNGSKQLEGAVAFPPMRPGRMSLGVRQNRVSWFKGCLSQVRFTPAALPPEALRRVN